MAQKSELLWGIAQQSSLRWRVESIVREYIWITPTEDVWQTLPVDHLAWAVASDPSVQAAIKAWMDAQPQGSLNAGSYGLAIGAITDAVMKPIVIAALQRARAPKPAP